MAERMSPSPIPISAARARRHREYLDDMREHAVASSLGIAIDLDKVHAQLDASGVDALRIRQGLQDDARCCRGLTFPCHGLDELLGGIRAVTHLDGESRPLRHHLNLCVHQVQVETVDAGFTGPLPLRALDGKGRIGALSPALPNPESNRVIALMPELLLQDDCVAVNENILGRCRH